MGICQLSPFPLICARGEHGESARRLGPQGE